MKFYKYLKKNLISCICFLTATILFLSGGISFAKYASEHGAGDNSSVGSFICTARVDEVSALSFTNTAFWGGSVDDDRIAMNALRSIDFSVYNYNHEDVHKKPSEVKLGYSLSFAAPANFISKLAFQLFDGESAPMLPQIVVQDLFGCVEGGQSTGTYNTSTSEDFNGTASEDMSFDVVKGASGSYTATSGTTVIRFTPFVQQMQQTLNFRVWDVSAIAVNPGDKVETESGKLLAPLVVKYTSDVLCYRISVSMPHFKMNAATAESENYSFKIAPTAILEDEHLGGAFYVDDDIITEIYGGSGAEWTMKSIYEQYTDTYPGEDGSFNTSDDVKEVYGQNLFGGLKVYEVGPSDAVTNTRIAVDTVTTEEESEGVVDGESYSIVAGSDTSTKVINEIADLEAAYPGIDPDITEGWYTTYTYNIPVERQVKKITNKTKEIEYKTLTTTTETDVTETITTDSISDDKLTIEQTVSKQKVVTESTHTTSTTETIETQTSETRTIKGVRTIVFTETGWGSTYINEDKISWEGKYIADLFDDNSTVTVQGPTEVTISQSVGDPVTTTSGPTKVSDTTEIFKRTIQRSFKTNSIIIDEASRKIGENTVIYTSDNKFNLLGADGLQDYFISQSYSKNYPLSVNVIFEQIFD